MKQQNELINLQVRNMTTNLPETELQLLGKLIDVPLK